MEVAARTVILLGVVSLLTDISSEMVSTVLPLYLVDSVGLNPLEFGVVDGIHQGGAALVRVASGSSPTGRGGTRRLHSPATACPPSAVLCALDRREPVPRRRQHRTRTIRTLTQGIECPSLSPGRDPDRLQEARRQELVAALDYRPADETRTQLAETARGDDQAEWLGDGRIDYGRDGSIWVVPADGTGHPERLIEGADSPAVVR